MGRPSKLTHELQEAMVADLKKGHYRNTVARAHGISVATFCGWMARGSRGGEGDDAYVDFFEAVERAQAEAEIDLGNTALDGDGVGVGNGRARCAQWMLARTRGKKFGEKISLQVKEEVSMILDVVEKVLPPEWADALYAAIEDVDEDGIPRTLSAPESESAPTQH